jgi:glycyl-tRNA synthetase
MSDVSLEEIVSLCKRRGFIYQGSEIYGGLAGTWDYGPLGVALKKNIMNLWWQMFVEARDDMYGVDAAILMNQKVWEASGHTETFTDPIIECTNCGTQQRVDKLLDEAAFKKYLIVVKAWFAGELDGTPDSSKRFIEKQDLSAEELSKYSAIANDLINHSNDDASAKKKLIEAAEKYQGKYTQQFLNSYKPCPNCGAYNWHTPKLFNLMFKTVVGPTANENSTSYLRPETAQGIFTNFKNVVDSFYPDVPFGVAQQGKAFRNEISPRDFVFRSREFEQMEIEYFVHPDKWEEAFEMWRERVHEWFKAIGLPEEKVHELEVPDEDRAHYSKRTIDFEFDFPHGRDELLGLAYRTDFDLMNIQRASGKSMEYRPKDGGAAFVPHVIEPSFGVERAIMAVLTAAYTEDEIGGEKRSVLKLPKHLAPVKAAVSPLLKNKPELVDKAREVYAMLKKELGAVMYDDNGNIGKRYRRQDEIGTPACIVIDFQTLEDHTVTVRDRDTTKQERVKITDLVGTLSADR